MIRYLVGNILKKEAQGLTLLTEGGIGFFLYCPFSTLRQIGSEGGRCELFVSSILKPDRFQLYGFISERDLLFFEDLLSISGIGPKIALSFLGPYSSSELMTFLIDQNVDALSQIPGVGLKKAERLLFESGHKVTQKMILREEGERSLSHDLKDALSQIGFSSKEIHETLERLSHDLEDKDLTFESALRLAIRPS